MPDALGPWFCRNLAHGYVQLLSRPGFGAVGVCCPVPGRSQVIDGGWSGVTPLGYLGCGETVEHGRVVEEAVTLKDRLCALKEWDVCGV
jgi:hypothetical protein